MVEKTRNLSDIINRWSLMELKFQKPNTRSEKKEIKNRIMSEDRIITQY